MPDTDTKTAVPPEATVVDFFTFSETKEFPLRNTDQYVVIKRFTEGDRRKYLNATSRELSFDKSGNTSMHMRAGDDRRALLDVAIVDWHVLRGGRPLEFNRRNLTAFLDDVDPALVDEIEKAVRDYNPWLLQDVTLEDIDEQISDLEELRKKKLLEEEGKGD